MIVDLFVFLIAFHLAVSLRIQQPVNSEYMDCSVNAICLFTLDNCSDEGLVTTDIMKAPNSPVPKRSEPLISWSLQRDTRGDLVPVLLLHWSAPLDDSVKTMQGSEVFVLEQGTNKSVYIRYMFNNKLPGRNPDDEVWSFTCDRVVVDPGCQYSVSFSHLPKLNKSFDIRTITEAISIPDCKIAQIKECELCVRHGDLWQPNITWAESQRGLNKLDITISFDDWIYAEKYKLVLNSTSFSESKILLKSQNSQRRLNDNFTLDLLWLIQSNQSCQLSIEVTPVSGQCIKGCVGHGEKINICNYTCLPFRKRLFWFVPVQVLVVLAGGYLGVLLHRCFHKVVTHHGQGLLRMSIKDVPPDVSVSHRTSDQSTKTPAKQTQRILILYSLDHSLYKEIVLKLCAFLRARCGAEVTLDLLDSAQLSTVGQLQWLEMQRRRVHSSSDKILILCSRGVAAKWEAMCSSGSPSISGGPSVTLREDLASPVGDMFTPALALIVPDFVRSVSLEKYMVAYFEEVSGEDDVPSLFHVTMRYKLMRHFEQLLFRILGQEQHEPGRVKRIYGITENDYFHCPTGKALQDAIKTFRAYQLDNPDWFKQELVGYTEEMADTGLDSELPAKTVHSHIQETQNSEGDSVLTASVLTQAMSHASFHGEYVYIYPSANELVLADSPKLTLSQVCCQSTGCSEPDHKLLTAHTAGSEAGEEESEEFYWCARHSNDCEEHPRQELIFTDQEDE
ncbi:hypothetical protein ACEWY4_010913 [Coilia grayii]|uniref:SEFIR domain-containing protein n=1 Tax=Coilia grayii TaxID=363190 RepID=A0ABD1K3J0_9TELE